MVYEFYNSLRKIRTTPDQEWKNDLQALVEEEFENSPTLQTILHKNTEIQARVVGVFSKETPTRRIEDYQKIIFRQPDYSVSIGDIFEFDNSKWLCTDLGSTPVTKSCMVERCNNTLRLFKNNVLYQVPVIVEDHSMGYKENRYLADPDDNIIVRLPYNDITKDIGRNGIYRLTDYDNYKIISVNRVTEPGLIIIKMKVHVEEQQLPVYNLTILNGESIQISNNQSLTINTQVTVNDEVVSGVPLLYFSSNEEIATISNTGIVTIHGIGTVTFIVVLENNNIVGDSIVVEIIVKEVDNINYTFTGDNEIIKGFTKSYLAAKYNNGAVVAGQFAFTVIPNSTPSSAYTLTVINDNSCSITANQATHDIILRATDVSSGEFVERNIKLRNLV